MNAIRFKKEARALFWPWCAVMVAAALPLLPGVRPWIEVLRSRVEGISMLAFFLGIDPAAGVPLVWK